MAFFDKFLNSKKSQDQRKFEWINLENSDSLEAAVEQSYKQAIVIFKHSTRCSISSMAKDRLERSWDIPEENAPLMYYLDLIAYRSISNQIAERFKVHHESPQLILIKNGEAIYDASHNYITIDELKESLV